MGIPGSADLTRGDIFRICRDEMGETFGTEAEADYQGWRRLITDAADYVARHTRCYYRVATTPIVANVALYKTPQLISINAAGIYTPDGTWHLLDTATLQGQDDYNPAWRGELPQDQPGTLLTGGLNDAILYPAPNFDSAVDAYTDLVLEGGGRGKVVSSVDRPFVNDLAPAGDVNRKLCITDGVGFTPGWYTISDVSDSGHAVLLVSAGTEGSTGGTASLSSGGLWMEGPGVPGDSWDNDNDPCPLVSRAHMAVVWLACYWRCRRRPSKENMARRGMFKEDLDDVLGLLEHEQARFTQATRVPSMVGDNGGPVLPFSPLTY